MKALKFAYFIFSLLLIAVITNSIILGNIINTFISLVGEGEENDMRAAKEEYEDIYERYKSLELYISLTVNHGDLENIESAFAEIIGAARAEDRDGVITTKSRLIDYLDHIRRLSGINIDSVF